MVAALRRLGTLALPEAGIAYHIVILSVARRPPSGVEGPQKRCRLRMLLTLHFCDAARGLSSCTENLQASLDNHLLWGPLRLRSGQAFASDAAFAAPPLRMTEQFKSG